MHTAVLTQIEISYCTVRERGVSVWRRGQSSPVTAELKAPTVVAAWLRAAVEAPEGAARLVSWV